jgi:hypothetical protein
MFCGFKKANISLLPRYTGELIRRVYGKDNHESKFHRPKATDNISLTRNRQHCLLRNPILPLGTGSKRSELQCSHKNSLQISQSLSVPSIGTEVSVLLSSPAGRSRFNGLLSISVHIAPTTICTQPASDVTSPQNINLKPVPYQACFPHASPLSL